MNYFITALLKQIEYELEREYWNKYQKQINSPFRNSGECWNAGVFKVRSYNWNGNYEPNFEYKGLKVWWYKYLGRGMEVELDNDYDLNFYITMLTDCKTAIKKYFDEL